MNHNLCPPSGRRWADLRRAALSLGLLGLPGCGLIDSNIFDTTITLQSQSYKQDFGANMGTTPTIPCSSDALCDAPIKAQIPNAAGRCEAQKCYADVSVTLPYTVDLSKDTAFQSGIGQKAVQSVRAIKLAYTIPSNSLTFDLPEISIYVGPQSATAVTDAGVALIGKIPPTSAGKTLATPGVLDVADGSDARKLLVAAITTPKTPLVFLLYSNPKFTAGKPLPAGQIQVSVTPSLVVGLPR